MTALFLYAEHATRVYSERCFSSDRGRIIIETGEDGNEQDQ